MNIAPTERFFYHSFPRPQKESASVSPGLNVLSSMLRSGLLLTPEVISWGQPGSEELPKQKKNSLLSTRRSFKKNSRVRGLAIRSLLSSANTIHN